MGDVWGDMYFYLISGGGGVLFGINCVAFNDIDPPNAFSGPSDESWATLRPSVYK